jgi:hypothetical protein
MQLSPTVAEMHRGLDSPFRTEYKLMEPSADEFVRFEWDERKSDATLAGRGFDFSFAVRIWAESKV